MTETTTVHDNGPGWRRWWLPVLLALLILAIVLGAYFATHHSRAATPKSTPTPTSTPGATATLLPTATASPRAAGTSHPHPTATPRPRPSATPRPAPTSTPRLTPTAVPRPTRSASDAVKTGTFTYSATQLHTIQQGANAGNSSYTYYLDPITVVQRQLPQYYGFTGGAITLVSPSASSQPTPTAYSNTQGLPEIKITVQYQGKRYVVVLDQPETQGAKGIWVIVKITAA